MKQYIATLSLWSFGILAIVYFGLIILENIFPSNNLLSQIILHLDAPLLASGLIAFGIYASEIFISPSWTKTPHKSDNFLPYGLILLIGVFIFFGYEIASNM